MSLYMDRVRQGLCGHCGKAPKREGRNLCQACHERITATARRRYMRIVNEGRCVVCGEKARPGKTRCMRCAVRGAEKSREAYRKKVEMGVCVWCGKAAPEDGKVVCRACWKKYRGQPK